MINPLQAAEDKLKKMTVQPGRVEAGIEFDDSEDRPFKAFKLFIYDDELQDVCNNGVAHRQGKTWFEIDEHGEQVPHQNNHVFMRKEDYTVVMVEL